MPDEIEGVKFSEFSSATPENADEVVGLHAGNNARFSVANFILAIRQGLANLFVPLTRTVNNKALSADITLDASDVGAVPDTREVNGKALSSDITLDASDVGAVDADDVGVADGIATLDNTGKVPSSQLPSIPATAADVSYDNTQSGLTATDVQDAIDEVLGDIPSAYTSNPAMDGTASPGSSGAWARGDHVHPSDTSRLPVYGMGMNLMDNAYFVGGGSQQGAWILPINQRGQGSYTGQVDGIDRWNNVSNTTVTLYADGVVGNGLRQYIEASRVVDGHVYTLSLLTENGLKTATGVLSTSASGWQLSLTGSGGWAGVQYTSGKYDIRITGSQKNKAIQLEPGPVSTLCHNEGTDANPVWVLNRRPNYAVEMWKCQQYQIVFHSENNKNIGFAYRYSSSDADICIPLPVSMRAAPTVETSSTFRVIRDGGATNITASTLNGVTCNLTENMATIRVSVNVGGNGRLDGSGSATLILNANL